METHGIFYYWSLLGALAVLGIVIFCGVESGALRAQTLSSRSTSSPLNGEQANTNPQEQIPADHYDPDDIKITRTSSLRIVRFRFAASD